MKCKKCGNEFDGNVCPHCGTSVEQPQSKGQPLPPHKDNGTVCMVLGILGLLLSTTFGCVLAIIAIILGAKCKNTATPGRRKVGMITSYITLGLAVIFLIAAAVSPSDDSELAGNEIQIETESSIASEIEATDQEVESVEPVSEIAYTEEASAPVPATSETDDNVPTEYKSALNKANSYSDTMHMSKQGIYDQLTSEYGEQFSAEAAQYAIDNMEADWNYNALQMAQSYSDNMHMSKQGIYDQLTSEYGEQFTPEEAQYAVDNVDADWNYNALQTAKNYQENMDMSPEAIRDQLTSEYGEQFTQEEADYAIENLE